MATLLAWATHSRVRGIWIAALVAFVADAPTFWMLIGFTMPAGGKGGQDGKPSQG